MSNPIQKHPLIIRKVYRYRGEVQGVGFRANAIHQARGLTITGFIRNEPNGDVTMDVQGSPHDVQELAERVGQTMSAKINETLVEQRESISDRDRFRITTS
ncbi:acylphosphatase [Neorhodopirellula pilleata]|uniref:acylphosphatase n=1 Tax=Neorhodopirellula pilleata TaxID=2714738 RepID=A0A5C6AFV6_9BACT|nr:acylphosphatase [Neorhodopirellula pilleata]TWT98922.1 Acylphosphatase [Neorhodopirellula pilleata]